MRSRFQLLSIELDTDAQVGQERLEFLIERPRPRQGAQAQQKAKIDRIMVGIRASRGKHRIVGFEQGPEWQLLGVWQILRLCDDVVQDGNIWGQRSVDCRCAFITDGGRDIGYLRPRDRAGRR